MTKLGWALAIAALLAALVYPAQVTAVAALLIFGKLYTTRS